MGNCNCNDPNVIQCEDYQLAICKERNGNCYSKCITPPSEVLDNETGMINFVVSMVLERDARSMDFDEKLEIFNQGKYSRTLPDGIEEVITFKIPRNLPPDLSQERELNM